MKIPVRALAILLLLSAPVLRAADDAAKPRGRFGYPPKFDGARAVTYKEVDGTKLQLWIFDPADKAAEKSSRPAIVFFFGGGWTAGSPVQFEKQCRHFASRGMVAITADYRVANRQGVKPAACVADAKSCIRWIRKNAERLGIDPNRIVAAGGSAGGHLAAAVATLPGLDEPGEDTSISAVPAARVLFNPALVMAPIDGLDLKGFASKSSSERFGCEPTAISPAHHVHAGQPPTLILHGKADTTVPIETAETFAAAMKKAGNRCELVGYEGQTHGFFNAAKYDETLAEADRFLVSLGILKPPGK
jgi:acetyl esterase/lipase